METTTNKKFYVIFRQPATATSMGYLSETTAQAKDKADAQLQFAKELPGREIKSIISTP